ncbi:MAG: hypothetical protein J5864_08580 [Oscillospiraceae bacterium]|nr:hypothetical protein [Oscillospiraceae bacterium]
MNAEQLRDTIGKIDDRFIEEAEHYEPEIKSRKPIWIITSASAAVIALCTCVHYHNAVNKALRPEIDNTVAIVTTVTETELYETDVLKTEKPVQASDTVRENTEVTETETGYESSISYAETVPAKTEASSENGGSSGEKTVLTQKPQEVTKIPATEPEKVTAEVHTVVPVTEPAATDKPAETEMTYPPKPQGTAIAMTENIITEPQFIPNPAGVQVTTTESEIAALIPNPDYVPQLHFFDVNEALETIQKNDVSLYSEENREAFRTIYDRLFTDGKFFVQTAEKPIDAEKNSSVNILTRTEKNDICIEYNLYYKNKVFIVQFCYADKEIADGSADLTDYLFRRLNMETDSYITVKGQPFLIDREENSYMKNIYSVLDKYHYLHIYTSADKKELTDFLEAFSFEAAEISDLSKK